MVLRLSHTKKQQIPELKNLGNFMNRSIRNKDLSMTIKLLSSLLISLMSVSIYAENELKALVGGRLIDGYGGTPIANSVILIRNNIIEAVGNTDNLVVPNDYKIISTEGMDVLPGLWDSHVHMMAAGHGDYRRWFAKFGTRILDEVVPAKGEQFLLSGVTTVRDLGAPLKPILTARKRFNDGTYLGPRLLVAGPFLQLKPYPGTELARWGINDVQEAKDKVNKLADAGVDFIKLIDIDWMGIEKAKAVVNTAHARGLKVISHSRRPEEVKIGIQIGIDNFEHSGSTSAPDYSKETKKIIMSRTAIGEDTGVPLYWTPTAAYYSHYSENVANPEFIDDTCWQRGLGEDIVKDIKASLAHPERLPHGWINKIREQSIKHKTQELHRLGVVLLVGTDNGIPFNFSCQSTADELVTLSQDFGLPVMDIIRGATYWPAKLMGVFDKWGTVEQGKYADIIAIKGDILRYPALFKRVDLVIKDGVLYKENGQAVETAFVN